MDEECPNLYKLIFLIFRIHQATAPLAKLLQGCWLCHASTRKGSVAGGISGIAGVVEKVIVIGRES